MKRYIHIKKEDREFIMASLKVTERMVYYAIRFEGERGNTDLARKIRRLAMERGGIIMVVTPEVETLHDSDEYMRQYFPNGVELEFAKKGDAGCDVLYKGKVVRHYDNVMVRDIPAIQKYASELR